MRDGAVNVAQARVIVEATTNLPNHLGPAIKDDAEARLVGFAADFGPRELKRLGAHILDVVAPEVAEAEDAQRLAALEDSARARSSLRTRSIGEGMSRTTWVHPTVEADRLLTYADAYTNPRRDQAQESTEAGLNDWEHVPLHRRRAWALTALLEHLDPERIPNTGGVPTQVVVGITLDALRTDLATATVTGHGQTHDLTAEQTRRLACSAQILPARVRGKSQIIDAGRIRFHRRE